MRDIFWEITKWAPQNNIPLRYFDAPLWPLIAIARARRGMLHLLNLLDRRMITMKQAQNIVRDLQLNMGITLEWTVSALVEVISTFKMELFPCNSIMGVSDENFQFVFFNALYYALHNHPIKDIYNFLKRLETDGTHFSGIQILNIYDRYYLFGAHNILLNFKSDFWPLDVLYKFPNVTIEHIEWNRDRNNDYEGNIVFDVLYAHYSGAQVINIDVALKMFEYFDKHMFLLMIKLGNNSFYEFLINESPIEWESTKIYRKALKCNGRRIHESDIINKLSYIESAQQFIDICNNDFVYPKYFIEYDNCNTYHGARILIEAQILLETTNCSDTFMIRSI